MAKLTISDLVESKALDSKAMSAVRGGQDAENYIDFDQDQYTRVYTDGDFSPVLVNNVQHGEVDADQWIEQIKSLTALL